MKTTTFDRLIRQRTPLGEDTIAIADGPPIAQMLPLDPDLPGSSDDYAALFCAAPELLSALEETLEELEIARGGSIWPTGASAVAHRASAALAKAKGGAL